MQITGLLIANRGEIAIRICRTAHEMGIRTVTIYAEEDQGCLHVRKSDETYPLRGKGVQAYLDTSQIIALAKQHRCNAIHPGYGFLSEQADFARTCQLAGIHFVGPTPDVLELFGDKVSARQLAVRHNIPVVPGMSKPATLPEAEAFRAQLGEDAFVLIKAAAGGGGRGMRLVGPEEDLAPAFARSQSEARNAFGHEAVFLEKYIPEARHLEIQVMGDGAGKVASLGERECSIQRRHQKLIEIAPCPGLADELRTKLTAAALTMARAVDYRGAGTFEFLVADLALGADSPYYFIETNPRLQVEHTITEAVTGLDIVRLQLEIAQGRHLSEVLPGYEHGQVARGSALQMRINMESVAPDGRVIPQVGRLAVFEPPTGPGIRVDAMGYAGYENLPAFDSLLAKLICHSPSPALTDLINKSYRNLCEFNIQGIQTNIPFLQNLLQHPVLPGNRFHTRFVDLEMPQLVKTGSPVHHRYFFEQGLQVGLEGPLQSPSMEIPPDLAPVRSPMPGSVVSIEVATGDRVRKGQPLLILEAMKMENVIQADQDGVVKEILIDEKQVIAGEQVVILFEPIAEAEWNDIASEEVDPDYIRPDLAEVKKRRAFTLDENRPEAVAKRRRRGKRTAWENVLDLSDPDSFREYGAFTIAAQRARRPLEDLIKNTPADGFICGLAHINGHWFAEERTRSIIMAYDFTVLAGTQGTMNHHKLDRMLGLAEQWQIPVVLFAEGGGGRPGDVDQNAVAGLHIHSFYQFARLSGSVPVISIVSRYCFAGNAALAGCSDVIIATRDTSIGMGGPAMIEGGGLGKFHPAEVGPVSAQTTNGVIDILVENEEEAVQAAKQYLSYFQGPVTDFEVEDQRLLRQSIPENRKRIYDIRGVIHLLADRGSVLELRPHFGTGMITAFIRIEGRPVGLIANNPAHLAGAIDSDGADKAARFMQLCNTFGLPILSLCDTPGIMVGPEAEKTGTVRHASRMFVVGASLDVPFFTVVLRKGYGLGAMAMASGGFHSAFFTIAWPTGEFGAMGLEGAVRLGFRKELENAGSPDAQKALFDQMVTEAYQRGKALNVATLLEIDEVIDPFDTRKWVLSGLQAASAARVERNARRRFVDPW